MDWLLYNSIDILQVNNTVRYIDRLVYNTIDILQVNNTVRYMDWLVYNNIDILQVNNTVRYIDRLVYNINSLYDDFKVDTATWKITYTDEISLRCKNS